MWCVPLCLHRLWFGIPCEALARSREADSDQVRARRTSLVRRPVPDRVIAVQGQHLQQCSFSSAVL
ncbi:hypothetical protein Taro_001574 [Colocasia esculenta]|uniref:Secreted protein n=1 Tax=Colocasia esculenta TaxID=4460 RepID=A0A843TIG7_COLES|nr:hypothetical protein [Colocasia esculenta]